MNRYLPIFLFCSLNVDSQLAYCQDSIAINSLPFQSQELKELRDSQEIIKSLAGSQIIFLGEGGHGDGSTLEIKNELIKYLVLNHGYEVILFERSFYELYKVNSLIKNSELSFSEAKILLENSFRNEQFISRELQATCTFIASQRNKIDIGGIDLPYRSRVLKLVQNDLRAVGIEKNIAREYQSLLTELAVLSICSDCETKFQFENFRSISDKILKAVRSKGTGFKLEFIVSMLESNLYLADWVESRPKVNLDMVGIELHKKFIHRREQGLYHNLIWQLNTRYRGKKIIVSTSTFHMSLDDNEETMVNYLPDSIKRKAYFLPFIWYEGKTGYDSKMKMFNVVEIKSAEYSIEALLHASGAKFSFIDFNSLNEAARIYINDKEMHPSGLLDSDLDWLNMYNGLFFIDTMKPTYWRELPSDFDKKLNKIIK